VKILNYESHYAFFPYLPVTSCPLSPDIVSIVFSRSWDSSVSIVTRLQMGWPRAGDQFPAEGRARAGSGAHPDSYTMGTRSCFHAGKAAGA
jgi:hypothetical protein